MKEQLVRLIELQKVESAAGKIHAKRKNLPVQMKILEQEFNLFCEVVETQREQMESARKRRQEKDAQLQAGQESLKRTRERLFEVRTNKEYQSMLKEIEVFEEKNSRIEDEIGEEKVVLIDCITLLVNNIFGRFDEKQFEEMDGSILEKQVLSEIEELQNCFKKVEADFIIVSNEVGLGIVPDNRMGRLYRDILGRANQMLARSSSEVYLMVAGIPLRVKPQNS